jgi:hypothetical protein
MYDSDINWDGPTPCRRQGLGLVSIADVTKLGDCRKHKVKTGITRWQPADLASARADNQIELVATDKRMLEAAELLGLYLFPA